MRAAPAALLDDGMLEVIVLEDVSKLAFLTRLIPKVFKGEHVELPERPLLPRPRVSISCERAFDMYADGDPIGRLPVRVRALQGAIRMLVPAGGRASPRLRRAGGPPAGEPGAPESG